MFWKDQHHYWFFYYYFHMISVLLDFRVLFLFVLFNFFRLWRKQLKKCTRSSRLKTQHYVLLINCLLKTCLSDFIMKINERLLTWKHLFHRTIFNLLLIRDEQYCLVQCVTNCTFDFLCIKQKPWSYESIGYTDNVVVAAFLL